MKTMSRRLSEYAVGLSFDDLNASVIHEVKRRMLDSLGCALGAFWSTPGVASREVAKTAPSLSGSTVLGLPLKVSPDMAAFTNGILVRYLDYNDTYLSKEPAHPSDNIPAAIAVGESQARGGKELIAAIALGYELQCRLCDAASLRSLGWYHVAYVSASTALLSANLMGLDALKAANALSLGITPNLPLRQTRVGELSMWKGCAAGNAARGGVFAALIAAAGITGPAEVFEGQMGLMNQATGPFFLDIDGFGKKGENFKILDTYIKYYPSEYHSQAAVEAALLLREGLGSISDIEEIYIETYDACVDIIAGDESKWNPATRETADHSLPYIVAVALMDGKIDLEQFSADRIKDPELNALVQKVKVERNDEHNEAYPESFPCMIEITTKDGARHKKTVDYPKGHPKNPLSDKELIEKFNTLNQGLVADDKVEEIMDKIWHLERLENISELMELFVVGA